MHPIIQYRHEPLRARDIKVTVSVTNALHHTAIEGRIRNSTSLAISLERRCAHSFRAF